MTTTSPFCCPRCQETYAPHWRDPGARICRSCAAERDGRCNFPTHPHPDHPCSWGGEQPGTPCRYCAAPTPANGTPCPTCWTPVGDIPPTTLRTLLADAGLELAPRPS